MSAEVCVKQKLLAASRLGKVEDLKAALELVLEPLKDLSGQDERGRSGELRRLGGLVKERF